jgi:hypothetical protein
VECPQRSGALQSAQLAWDAGLVRGEPGLWWRPSNPGL